MELRKHLFPEAELVDWREGHTDGDDTRVAVCSGGVRDQRMRGHVSHGSRETSERRQPVIEYGSAAGGKADRRNPSARAPEESDGVIVPQNLANKGPQRPAESGEGRTPAKRNPQKSATDRVQDRGCVSNALVRVRQRAEAEKTEAFVNLFHLLKVPLLRRAFYALQRRASPGLDGVNWHQYERRLESRLPELQDELHKGSYRATPAKRTYLIKPDGRKRPLGMQAIEDKVVQMACVMILNEVFEPTFCGFSYGSRPGRRPHDALDALHEGICRQKINWILDCDIEGFFDQLPHDKLMEILEERVKDPRMLRLIRKWLRVGWVEDGVRHPGTIGTPQGSVISPLLANIFLNAVMDRWVSRWRREDANGDLIAIRYVDDAVFGFQREADARRFLAALRDRLEAYGMRLHPGKTRLIEFGRFAASNRKERGEGETGQLRLSRIYTHLCKNAERTVRGAAQNSRQAHDGEAEGGERRIAQKDARAIGEDRWLAGGSDSGSDELLCGSREHESGTGVLHPSGALVDTGDSPSQPESQNTLDMGTLLSPAGDMAPSSEAVSSLSKSEI